jgi:hypothetical protein
MHMDLTRRMYTDFRKVAAATARRVYFVAFGPELPKTGSWDFAIAGTYAD